MSNTTHLKIPFVMQNQAQKEVTVNEAFVIIDALLNTSAKTIGSNSPPKDPQNGDVYIIGTKALNEWVGKENNLAYFYYGWKFIKPNEGLEIWVSAEKKKYLFDGTKWCALSINFL
jgi:hypothetical protein